MRGRTLSLALVVSAVFNVAFVTTAAFHLRHDGAEPSSCFGQPERLPAEFLALAERLERDLAPLRHAQAEDTRLLASLMSASEPDLDAIDRCLDRLADNGRRVHAKVVSTILAQREVLPDDQRVSFCAHIQNRLCNSPALCAPVSCGAEGPERQPENDVRPGGP